MEDEPQSSPAEAFERLGHETRIAILQAFVEHRRRNPKAGGLSFAQLRESVGMRDSGQFNYHLDKLRDRFVSKDEDTYDLTHAGEVTAAAILSGSYDTDVSRGPAEIDESCFVDGCDSSTIATYEDGILTIDCEANDHGYRTSVPPAAATDRSIDEVLDIADEQMRTHIRYIGNGACFKCVGPLQIEPHTDVGDEETGVRYEATCERCGTLYRLTAWLVTLPHPTIQVLCWDHGVVSEETRLWELRNSVDRIEQSIESEDPLRVRVTVEVEGETRSVAVDSDARVRALPES